MPKYTHPARAASVVRLVAAAAVAADFAAYGYIHD